MPQQATPTALTQKIIVLPASKSVSVINAGPPGPRGEIGPIGYLEENETIGPLIVPDATEPTHALNLRSANARYAPPGTVISGIWTNPPFGYSFFGVTITNAQVNYPEFWDEIPDDWKVGVDAVIPSMTDGTLMESISDIGTVAGSNTHVLISANLPPHAHAGAPHTHPINHDHGSVNTGNENANHYHGVNIATDTESVWHQHNAGLGDVVRLNPFTPTASISALGVGAHTVDTVNSNATLGSNQNALHYHNVNGITGTISANHQHALDMPLFTGTSGAASAGDTGNGPGTSTAVDHTPKHLKLRFAIRIAA